MTAEMSFLATRPFHARAEFPYGLDRSGEFTRTQVQLLTKHGTAYQALDRGEREAVTQDEVLFVQMCRGKREATTEHEKAWQRFRSAVAKPIRYVSLAGGSLKASRHDQEEQVTDLDDDYE